MNPLWFWDNVRLKKDERTQLIYVNCLLAVFILIKMGMVFLYSPEPIEVDIGVLAKIEMSPPVNRDYSKKNYASTDLRGRETSDKASPSKHEVSAKGTDTKLKNKEKSSGQKSIVQAFPFDPNTISRDSLKMLGLSRYTINSLLKYRSKGGQIRSKDQFSKFNGLDEPTIQRLLPLVSLPAKIQKQSSGKRRKYAIKNDSASARPYKKYKKKTPRIIDINTADTTDFQNLYGIGSVYSKRIVKYREYIGGFYEIKQINEVWGIEDSLYKTLVPYLMVDPTKISKQNINLISDKNLGKHPYVGWDKAKHIINYRKTHGSYKDMDELLKLHTLTKLDVDTLKIYFDVR